MKGFLNKYMESRRGDDDSYNGLISNFRESTEYILDQLGEKPFHLRGRLNYGALDSIMAAVLVDIAPQDLTRKFHALRQDRDYDDAITYNTSDDAAVHLRLTKAIEYLSDL